MTGCVCLSLFECLSVANVTCDGFLLGLTKGNHLHNFVRVQLKIAENSHTTLLPALQRLLQGT